MEKTAQSQYIVFRRNGELFLRCPNGPEMPYDNRFPDCPHLSEGEEFIKILED